MEKICVQSLNASETVHRGHEVPPVDDVKLLFGW